MRKPSKPLPPWRAACPESTTLSPIAAPMQAGAHRSNRDHGRRVAGALRSSGPLGARPQEPVGGRVATPGSRFDSSSRRMPVRPGQKDESGPHFRRGGPSASDCRSGDGQSRPTYRRGSRGSTRAPSSDRGKPSLGAAEFGETPGALLGDQSLQTHADEGSLFRDPGQLGRPAEQGFINVQCRSHMHHDASSMHMCQDPGTYSPWCG